MNLAHILGASCLFMIALLLRMLYLIFEQNRHIPKLNSRRHPVRTMIVLGSGGHTTEILRIISTMRSKCYSPRIYVRASTDTISEAKVRNIEGNVIDYKVFDIRRSREVHQSYSASVATTILAIFDSIPLVWTQKPDLILCNGPGTCVPLCIVVFILKLMFLTNARVIFIESFCRVKTLSLSGKILYYLADFVIVRWPYLNTYLYRRTVCL
ncbi:UDP-N-acetylglucosamine transferase subunit ALG14 [Neodiprion pinetum]|uniref:UDP-N-acetylglucosamine transferase subunit ALG14 n=1 Tax=Neodiprion lecontei TaxID=441921 RepID=A0A6J0C9V5_NEOLC|nr:UDP-N-acetylglucosamine transferase subunit ALG14 homolog [Neodiprion lecontei]XP_046481601.1 UDP-N-acetylglucosamine transferase subunit ALG14 homolog [Neodiprion pinetum]